MITATKPITIDDYRQMEREGQFFGQRVQLIGGELLFLSPQSNDHTVSIANVQDALEAIFNRRQYWVRNQGRLDLGPLSHPDPDIAVVAGSRRHWAALRRIPDHAILVVEVSDSTLSDDRNRKASRYAASGIADYWIVNLQDLQLEIRRDPQPDASEPFGFRYSIVTIHTSGEFVSPLAMPTGQVAVAELLPN
jgi:Uma2 family endonuclease